VGAGGTRARWRRRLFHELREISPGERQRQHGVKTKSFGVEVALGIGGGETCGAIPIVVAVALLAYLLWALLAPERLG